MEFNADEIFEMAEQIERNGGKFYRQAAGAADGKAKELLTKMAEMEDEHEATFTQMRADLAAVNKRQVTFDPMDETGQYLQAMTEGKIFRGDPCELLAGENSIDAILTTAISLEKDSIIFYQCMKPFVPPELGKERLSDIIDEEIGHILALIGLRDAD